MKGIYRGPGDSIQVDGVEFKKGETVDVTEEQARRIRDGGGELEESAPDAPGAPGARKQREG